MLATDAAPCAADVPPLGKSGKKRPPALLATAAVVTAAVVVRLCVNKRPHVRARTRHGHAASAPRFAAAAAAVPPSATVVPDANTSAVRIAVPAAAVALATLWAARSMLLSCCAAALCFGLVAAARWRAQSRSAGTRPADAVIAAVAQEEGDAASVVVTKHGASIRVVGSIHVAQSDAAMWRLVRSCLNGGSAGVLRDVQSAQVLARPAAGVCLLYQEVRWRFGPLLNGTNRLKTIVHTHENEKRLRFEMLSQDPVLKAYVGSVRVTPGATRASRPSCTLEMVQDAEGHANIVAAVAGATVLQRMLSLQTSRMLTDFKRAAERDDDMRRRLQHAAAPA